MNRPTRTVLMLSVVVMLMALLVGRRLDSWLSARLRPCAVYKESGRLVARGTGQWRWFWTVRPHLSTWCLVRAETALARIPAGARVLSCAVNDHYHIACSHGRMPLTLQPVKEDPA